MKVQFQRRWISPRECATYLDLHPQTVYSLIYQGKLPVARIGRSVRVDLQALQAGLEAQVRSHGKGNER
jgi:excisionase family DNA binding protein